MNTLSDSLSNLVIPFERDIEARCVSAFRGGGKLDFLLKPETYADLKRLFAFIKYGNIPYFVLGGGSNLLIDDRGFAGIAVSTGNLGGVWLNGEMLTAGAGVKLSRLAREGLKNNLSGLEPLALIPGTLGGAVYMNAGAYGREIGELIESVTVFDTESLQTAILKGSEIPFSYRSSGGFFAGKVILSASLKLFPSELPPAKLIRTFAEKRLASQPKEPSLGSVFKRSEGISAGYYIERAGLKGVRSGGAEISLKHAGFIINTGGATATDFLNLAAIAERAVREKYGITLEKEVEIIKNERQSPSTGTNGEPVP